MSRVAKAPVSIPAGVTVTLSGQDIKVKGPVGELSHVINGLVAVSTILCIHIARFVTCSNTQSVG